MYTLSYVYWLQLVCNILWRKRKLDYTWEQMHIATPNFWTRARLYYYIVILGRIRYCKYKYWFVYTWNVTRKTDMNHTSCLNIYMYHFLGYRKYWHFNQNWILAYFIKASATYRKWCFHLVYIMLILCLPIFFYLNMFVVG